jgi:single-strand DNA-binding protein
MNTMRNKVQLIGNLGKDPEIKKLSTGGVVATFTLATNEYFKNKDGKKTKKTQWHNIVAWGPKAEFAEKYLHKGSEVAIEGTLNHRDFENKDGEKRYITEVVAQEIMFVGAKKEKADLPF